MEELTSIITSDVPNVLNVQKVEDFHISLTKTVILKHHWIDSFTESIKNRTKHIKKFMILFGSLKIYCNEERTRTFIGLQIRTGYDSLIKLVESLDECLEEFSLPTFYTVCITINYIIQITCLNTLLFSESIVSYECGLVCW